MPFRNQVFRKLDVISANGQEILIDPGNINPQISFFSQDKTNVAFINAPNNTDPARVALGMNSGAYTYIPDGINRRIRCFLDDASGFGRYEQIKSSNGQRLGGFAYIGPTNGFFGWKDTDGGLEQSIRADTNGFGLVTSSAATFDFSTAKVSNVISTPGGNSNRDMGRGCVGAMFSTAGTVVSGGGAGPGVAVAAWTAADPIRFVDGRCYEIVYRGGIFSSVTAATEVGRVTLRSAVNSTAAQQLATWVGTAFAGASVSYFQAGCIIKNVSGGDIDKTSLGLCVERVAGTGTWSLFGNSTNFRLEVLVYDLGLANQTQFGANALQIT